MIWRLPHPVRAILSAFLVLVLESAAVGFGTGVPEFAFAVLVAVLVGGAASAWRPGRSARSAVRGPRRVQS